MSRESAADIRRERLTRDQRKALRKADFSECTSERMAEIRAQAERALAHLDAGYAKLRENGFDVPQERRNKNAASHLLTLECLAELAADA